MNVFKLRERLVSDYGKYVRSFITIKDQRVREQVEKELEDGLLWPDPLIQLNPSFEPGERVDQLVDAGVLHEECRRIFQKDKSEDPPPNGTPLRLHRHQADAIKSARTGASYVLTTGTGSGKSLSYIIPIVDHVLRRGSGKGIQAIVVYPMNALANSQEGELRKFLCHGYPDGKGPVTFARYTGQEREERRREIIAKPPDILLTNYVMLELILTRPEERQLVAAARGLRFVVLDELHTYRGRQGADVAMLVRRAREAFAAENLQYVGTSATLAGEGDYGQQRRKVAEVASLLFGTTVTPESVIGETLRRSTPARDLEDPKFVATLRERIASGATPPKDYEGFVNDPLSIWIESVFGLQSEPGTGRLIRTRPRALSGPDGAAAALSAITDLPKDRCEQIIEQQLLASYGSDPNPETGFPVFAFRLHQFISRGDSVYASIEPEAARHLTLQGQQFVPGDRGRVLLPLVFCRECGQEYYCIRQVREDGRRRFTPRELSDRLDEEGSEAGFFYTSPWPTDAAEVLERVPDDWLEEYKGQPRLRRDRRDELPKSLRVATDGFESDTGLDCHFISAPFRFCLNCGVAYGFRQSSDFHKLATLATEGRSTATTVLNLAAILHLREDESLRKDARKILSFTDNRQDASLQAGHFNDFIEIGLLRAALYKAAAAAGPAGITHENLVHRVFEALDLPIGMYAADEDVRFQALEETKRALRAVLGYRLYRDLERGWRITSPNLEQCGLLEIRYLSLDDLCRAEDVWSKLHPALATASPETRALVTRTLLDFMRRELCIKVDYLDPATQESIQQLSSQRLIAPWALDENEKRERSAILFPRPRGEEDWRGNIYLSPRGGFGQFLRRSGTFPELDGKLRLDDTEIICRQLLESLRIAGLVEAVMPAKEKGDVPGYQLPASAMAWVAGEGLRAFVDPVRVPRASTEGARVNPFFVGFYKEIASTGVGLEAREHTAQVRSELREDREKAFREGRLPILFCSPTMELGVDIRDLNVVNLRNVPPTPTNYAQRSGRAGRSGQPALVFAYCSTFSSHDQYFFRRPEDMVAGAVTPPRLDLANEDLIRAHVHALWLAEAGLSLGSSLRDVLNLETDDPTLELLASVRNDIENKDARGRASRRVERVLASIDDELAGADWWSNRWIEEALSQVGRQFEQACERWRGLYRAAKRQQVFQNKIINDHSRTPEERAKARQLRREAEDQLDLLTQTERVVEADFYSYRYFASEGFLPGYSFPRLPLSAFIPGRVAKTKNSEFLSRPRFLAISEFGPRAIVYHEGSRYRINRVIMQVEGEQNEPVTGAAKQCSRCGYIHPMLGNGGADLCERCGMALPAPLAPLFRLQNVSTKRAEKISSDEEERLRVGYEVQTGVRFSEQDGRQSCKTAKVLVGGELELGLAYGHAATLWRVNLGWRRRAQKEQLGFFLDIERGYWRPNPKDEDDAGDDVSKRIKRVIPYVEDRRNCLLVEPAEALEPAVMASLQAALKNAIQVEFQLEESELAGEPLPSRDTRNVVLLYESAEGGAGVLRRLIDDPAALPRVARRALDLCHFDPDTGNDRRRAPRAREDCEAACYDCLMSYSNQQDHELLDRKKLRDLLLRLRDAKIESSPGPLSRAEHLAELERFCQSELERRWLRQVEAGGLRLPSRAQALIEACKCRPDFLYEESQTVIYVDGPHHEYPERRQRDTAQTTCLEDRGYTVLRFVDPASWEAILAGHPGVFGKRK